MTEDLVEIWKEFLPVIQAQVAAVDQAAKAAVGRQLTDALRADGIANAHKLAGSLGSFDLMDASRAASTIERALKANEDADTARAQELSTLAAAISRDVESA